MTEINPRALMTKNSSICGMNLLYSSEHEKEETLCFIQSSLNNGIIQPIVSPFKFTLDTAAEAHEHVINRPSGTFGKVVLQI